MLSKNAEKFVEKSVYGIIVTITLLLTLENHEDNPWDMIATIVLTLCAFSAAEYYASVFGKNAATLRTAQSFRPTDLLQESLNMLYGSAVPVLFFILAGCGIISLLVAFDLGEFALSLVLIGYGYWYGRRRQRGKFVSALYGLANFGIVALIVALKLSAHF